jgi:hypothetical protein
MGGHNQSIRGQAMKLNILAVILGIGFAVTGIFAFAYPEIFFGLLGDYYGAFNSHFVRDAGIAFFSAGCLILLSTRITKWCVPLTLGGSLFIILHGVFHIQMLVMGMATTALDVAIEIIIIISPSVLTAFLLVLRIREHSQSSNN